MIGWGIGFGWLWGLVRNLGLWGGVGCQAGLGV